MDIQDLGSEFSEENRSCIYNNLMNNYIRIARENPQIEFHFFIPPYSMCYWDGLIRTNQLDYSISAMKYGIELLVKEENIHVYGFDTHYEITTNLDRYMDTLHYDAKVNELILDCIIHNEGEILIDDIDEYFEQVTVFYQNYSFPFE